MITRLLPPLALLVLPLACAGPHREEVDAAVQEEPIHLTILGINDLHGAVLDRPIGKPLDSPRKGGAAMMSAYIEAVRAENPGGVILVDAGDMLQGPLLCNRFEGLPVAEVYDHLEVDAAALGNHEFDYGPAGDGPATEQDGPFGALNAFLARAPFTPLSANLVSTGGPLPRGVQPHTIVRRKGVRVGLIGLTTPTTPGMSAAGNLTGVGFEPVGPATATSVAALRAQGAEAIVVLGHLEGGCRTERRWPPPEVCEPDRELAEVLGAAGDELDVVVLGHRHHWYANLVDGVAVVEAGSRGLALSRVDLYLDPVRRRVDRSRTRVSPPIPACEATPATGESCLSPNAEGPWSPARYAGRELAPDLEVERLLAPYVAELESLCVEPLATAAVPLVRVPGESAPGNLVADAMRAHGEGADVAILNSGSLRTNLPAGALSYCDVYALFPFDSRMVKLEVTGVELERILEFLTSGAHSMPQVSGVRLTVDGGEGAARDLDGDGVEATWERDRLLAATDEDGKPFKPDVTYRLMAIDYIIQRPGDAEFVFGQIPDERTSPPLAPARDAIVELLRATDTPLGLDGGWPLPSSSAPRVSIGRAREPAGTGPE